MKTTAMKLMAAGAVAALVTTTAFAAPQYDRRSGERDRSYDRGRQSESNRDSGYRDNQRVTMSGRVTSLSRERDGYRVQLDRGRDSYWIPESRLGRHARDLRVGVSIAIGGVFRGGMINVDAVNWPGDYGYDNGGYNNGGYGYDGGYLRGRVERVDYRDGFATIRDARSGRRVDVRFRDDLRGIRRGDFVTLEGQWDRGGVFDAYRIDDVR